MQKHSLHKPAKSIYGFYFLSIVQGRQSTRSTHTR